MEPEDRNEQPRRIHRWLVPAVGWAVSAASLWWVFRGFDWQQALQDLRSLHPWYVALAIVSDLLIYFCGGYRWRVLLGTVGQPSYWRCTQAIYIGLYANEILPLRPGEVIRCYLVARWSHLPVSLALSAAAIERIQEGVWLVLALAITTFFLDLPGGVIAGAQVLAGIVVVLFALVVWIGVRKNRVHEVVAHRHMPEVVKHIIDGVAEMGEWHILAISGAASFFYLFLQIVPVWALARGSEMDLTIWEASVVLIIIRVGTIIPNAPGNLGVYQVLCVVALGLFGVDRATAKTFSLMMFGVLTLPLLIGGGIAVALSGLKLDEIHTQARGSVPARPKESSI